MESAPGPFILGDQDLDLAAFVAVCRGERAVELGSAGRERIVRCDAFRRELAAGERRIYGVNTGFGRLADTVIPGDQQAQLQVNLLRSHAVGWGPALGREEVRGMILLRAASLAHGFSGVRADVVDQLLWLLAEDVVPWVPSRGSVGASGDLAPLAHLALVLIGEGHVQDASGLPIPAGCVLERAGRPPLSLEAKEGLALINGTQLMNGLGLLAVDRGLNLVRSAAVAAMLSLEALEGSAQPLGEAYHRLRPHREIMDVAACCRALLAGSGILRAHHACPRIQDPYSVRCAPQVLGASLGVIRHACAVLQREAAAVTDNPVLFWETGEVVTGGHFHGQPLAHQLDALYQGISEIAGIAERRINLLLGGNGGRLPRFLAAEPGLESGLMIAQYLAAALVSENKAKAFPAAVDSIPTSDGQEDHVSMGSVGALKLAGVLDRTEAVVGLEMLTAARALQFITRRDQATARHRGSLARSEPLSLSEPPSLSEPLAAVVGIIGGLADLQPGDRPLTADLERMTAWLRRPRWPAPTAACFETLAVNRCDA